MGEYASGKSEVAVNRALRLLAEGRGVTLVDLDLVEPFYTLRPIKKLLEEKGLTVVAWETRKTMGLGEAGSVMLPAVRWVLRRAGDLILDVGYGVKGARALNLIEGARGSRELKTYVVVNISRPVTGSVEDIVEYVGSLGSVDGLINNTHLGDETSPALVQEGARVITAAARELGLPVIATTATETVGEAIGEKDCMGNPVRTLRRYMPGTFW